MITKKEVIRYLGYRGHTPDDTVMALIDSSIDEVERAMEPKFCYRRFPVDFIDNQVIETAGIRMSSRLLARNLRGCSEVIFFAATLGSQADRLLQRYSKLQLSKAAVIQAAEAAAIEDFCNECQAKLAADLEQEGLYLRPRYSPGYGDLALANQRDFVRILDTARRVGIVLSEGDIMLPEKSVTAIIGVSPQKIKCPVEGCESCDSPCEFRRV